MWVKWKRQTHSAAATTRLVWIATTLYYTRTKSGKCGEHFVHHTFGKVWQEWVNGKWGSNVAKPVMAKKQTNTNEIVACQIFGVAM
jgi:hypothetical protein